LKLPEMRQVDQRVSGYLRLETMDRDAVAGYIDHRLHVAGGHRDRVLFPPRIVDVLHRRCGGVPRLINRVCDRALQLAYERGAERVEQDILDTALIEVGSATLSPTWDSIMFAEPAPVPPAPTTAVAPVQAEEKSPPKQEENLETLTPARVAIADLTPLAHTSQRPSRGIAPRRDVPVRRVRTDWPKDLRSETYTHRLWRKWVKGAAIAVAALVTLNVVIVGASVLVETLTPLVLPPLPKAPAQALPGIVPPAAPLSDAASAAVSSAAASAKYLVAVGVFANRDRADEIADTLTKAGLPAMQRTIQLRGQSVEQIVLGPFFSHFEAVAELRRLQALGGHDAAKVIDTSQ
jgi:cell division septation protein DedD